MRRSSDPLTLIPLRAPRLALHSQSTRAAESLLSETLFVPEGEGDNRITTQISR